MCVSDQATDFMPMKVTNYPEREKNITHRYKMESTLSTPTKGKSLPLYDEIDNLRAENKRLREDLASLYIKLMEIEARLRTTERAKEIKRLEEENLRLRKYLGEIE